MRKSDQVKKLQKRFEKPYSNKKRILRTLRRITDRLVRKLEK